MSACDLTDLQRWFAEPVPVIGQDFRRGLVGLQRGVVAIDALWIQFDELA
jgi:hypothetical protein